MKFRKWKSCFLVFVCCSLIGCSNNTKEEKLSEEVSDQVESKDASEISQNEGNKRDLFDSLPFHIEEKYSDIIQINADVIVSAEVRENGLLSIKTKLLSLDPEKVKEKLEEVSGEKFGEIEEREDRNYKNEIVCDYFCNSTEGNHMSVSQSAEDSSLFYRTQVTSHYEAAFRLANDLDYNGEKYQKPQEFPFATEEEIYKKFAEFGESLGISINDEHTTYYLDYETLAGEEEQQVNQGNIQPKNWTEADNAYYFCTSQESQGIPLYVPLYGIYMDAIDYNASMQARWGKSGLGYIMAGSLYTIETNSEYVKLESLETIFENLQKKYDLLIMNDTVTITKIKLYWMPELNKEAARPVWILTGKQNESGKEIQHVFDAETGKEQIGAKI